MTPDRLRRYLGEDEPLVRDWTGELTDGWRARPAVIAATDRRLIYLSDSGFRDVDYDHISSLSARLGTETDLEGTDYRLLVGAGAVLAVGAFLAAVLAGSGAVALVMVLAVVGGVALAEYGWKRREEFDGFRRHETERQRVTITTGDGRTHELAVDANADLDETLSRLVHAQS